ncbi:MULTISPECIES: hypothetical protein [unclassified Achromobacter]|uniref:hypothetical protein n=1 Tax=unclassified Achromobacter TaxID=2626865 RepID=UPI000B51DE1A|nr:MULTISPECIES: hypothetical protein [unclassified Achromobacter]OWT72727.1 hypothetical protein CEY05_22725 [Achromobacter sp. HZ34]OWT73946.1 hypothetical protein CEY04_21550 [Achromobacter sp. HZ28]
MRVRAGPPTRVPLRSYVYEARLLEAVAGLLPMIAQGNGVFSSADVRPLLATLLRVMLNPREAGTIAARVQRCVQACLAAQEVDDLVRLRQGYASSRKRLEDAGRQLVERWRWEGGERGQRLLSLFLGALDAGLEHCAARAMSRSLCEVAELFAAETLCPGVEPLPTSRARLHAALRVQAGHVQVLKASRESITQFIGRAVQCLPDMALGALAGAAAQAGNIQAMAAVQPSVHAPSDDGGLARHLPKLLFLAAADTVRDRLKARVITVAGAMRAEIDAGGDAAAALRLAWGRCRHALELMQTHAIRAAGVSLPDIGMLMADLLRLGGNSLEPGLLYRIYEGLPQALAARDDAVPRRLLLLALQRAQEVARKAPLPDPDNGNRAQGWSQLRELSFLRDMSNDTVSGNAPPRMRAALRRARGGVSLDSLDGVMTMSDHEFGCFYAAAMGLELFGWRTRTRAWREGYAQRIAVADEAVRAGAQRLLQLLRLPQVGVDALLRALRDLAEIVHARNTRSEALGLLATDLWRDETTRAHADALLAQATAQTGWDHAVAALAGPAAALAMRGLLAARGGIAQGRETAFEWPCAGRGRAWRLRTAIVWLEAIHAALWHRWMRLAGVSEWAAPQLPAPPGWSGATPQRWPAMLRAALAGEFGVLLAERPALPPTVLGVGVERAFLHACSVLPARLFATGKRASRCVRYVVTGRDGNEMVVQVCRDFLADVLDRVCLSFGISGVNAQGLALRTELSPWAGVEGGRDVAVTQAVQALLLLAGPRDARRLTMLLNRILVQPVWRVLAMAGRDAPFSMGDARAWLPQDSSSQIHVDVVRMPDGAYRLDVAVCFEQLRCVDVEDTQGGRRRMELDPHVSRVCVTYAVQAEPGFVNFSYLIGSAGFRYRLIARDPA